MWLPYLFATIVGIEHLGIMVLELCFPTSDAVHQNFGIPRDLQQNQHVKLLLANQAVYNGFIGVGIILSLFVISGAALKYILCLFTAFVVVAAVFGAVTVNKKIFFIQGLPALIAVLLIVFML